MSIVQPTNPNVLVPIRNSLFPPSGERANAEKRTDTKREREREIGALYWIAASRYFTCNRLRSILIDVVM